MRKVSYALFLVIPLVANAGPFGEGVKLKGPSGVDQAGCEGSQVIRREVERTGLNFVDGATQSWSCAGVSPGQAMAKRCPYPQYTANNNLNIRCYGNSRTEGPVVCLAKPSSEVITAVYGRGVGAVQETRPRFEELHVLAEDGQGGRKDYAYRMDDKGCRVERFRGQLSGKGSTVDLGFQECAETLFNVTHGGPMYPTLYPMKSTARFCQPSSAGRDNYESAFISAMETVARCEEFLPDFYKRYQAWKKERAQRDPTTTNSKKGPGDSSDAL